MSLKTPQAVALRRVLSENTGAAASELVRPEPDGAIRCFACGHRCKVLPGRTGVCQVRFNDNGTLRVPRGYVAGLCVDPIEKKPFYHAFPGRHALSFGMLGCDLHCTYCQNWITSQVLRDDDALADPRFTDADEVVQLALHHDCPVLTSTYNEPLITSEWAVEIFQRGRQHGLVGSYVSNGNGTPEVLEYLRPHVDLYKIDLKAFDDRAYRRLGCALDNVLDTIRRVHALGFWLEVVTLVVPTVNDTDEQLRGIAEFLASVSPDIPWHVTAFHPDYKLTDPPRTSIESLLKACEFGRSAGLHYVYAGNLPGAVGEWEHTRCPACGMRVIERRGFLVKRNSLVDGCCPDCGTKIPGVWGG